MSNVLSREQRGNGSLLARPFADIWGFDPFRNLTTGIDISRNETGYTVEMAVPGYKPEEIDINLEDSLLTVNGKNEKRSFTRSFSLPDEVDVDSIHAKVEHGMLTLTLPLSPKAQPKKIQIQVG